MKRRRSLYARLEIIRGEQCAGARPHAGRCWAAVQWLRSGPRRRCRHRGAVVGGRAPPVAVIRARSGRPAGVAGREDVRTPARPVVALSASSGPSGRADVQLQHPRVRCPGVRGIQGVRTDTLRCPRRCRRAVRALDPGVARCGGPSRPGAAGRRAAVVRGRRGRLPALVLTGRGWCGVGRRPWLARTRVDVAQGRRLAGVPAAAPPWPQRANTGAGPGPGCGGEHGTEQVLTAPAGRPGQVTGVVLTNEWAWIKRW